VFFSFNQNTFNQQLAEENSMGPRGRGAHEII